MRRRVEGLDKILQITTRGSTGLRIFDDNDNCNGNGIGKSGLNEFIIWLFFLRIKVRWYYNFVGELRNCQQERLYGSITWIVKEFFIKGDEELNGSTVY